MAAPPARSRSVVLLSGGLDSATVLALARAQGRDVYALSFRYGQRHQAELACASHQAREQGAVEHRIMGLDHLGDMVAGATALVSGSELAVPHEGAQTGIPITYVPARNTLFLSYALAWAEVLGAHEIWIGVNAVDYSGYPDCRPEFIEAFERLANLATRVGVEAPSGESAIRIVAPLIDLRKSEIIARGLEHGVDYSETLSCYEPVHRDGRALACRTCDSCRLREAGFVSAGMPDPAPSA
jgi:7-cyano-7-deazaguanine synthase